jgi:hypothetical protein
MVDQYISDLAAQTTPVAADLLEIEQVSDNTSKKSTLTQVFTAGKTAATEAATGVAELATSAETLAGTDTSRIVTPANLMAASANHSWILVPTANFTATPASTSTITMGVDMTASILVGMALKYTISGTVYYGQVTAISSILLTIRGAPLSADVTALYYGGGEIIQVVLPVNGTYEDASNTALLTSDNDSPITWEKPKSYCVFYKVWSRLHDTHATHGQASIRINNTEVNTTAGGLTIAADATWYATIVDIAVAAYDINYGESLEVTAVKGGTGDASDLNVIAVFVTP